MGRIFQEGYNGRAFRRVDDSDRRSLIGARNWRGEGSPPLLALFPTLPILTIALLTFLSIQFVANLRVPPMTSWEWDWNDFEYGSERRKRLLIIQESGRGPAADVMAVTSRLNRAYARKWGHDFARVTGVIAGNKPWHSTFNRAHILQSLISSANIPSYEYALMLGADAVIVDLDYDVQKMDPRENMVATNGNDLSVVYWDLNHVKIRAFAQQLLIETGRYLNDDTADGNELLTNLLDTSGIRSHHIKPPLIDYFAGEVIKHVRQPPDEDGRKDDWIRTNSQLIIGALEQIVDAVCYQFYPKCEVV